MRHILILAVFAASGAVAQPAGHDVQELIARGEAAQQAIRARSAVFQERQERVEARLKEACDSLFLTQPNETITNPLCYEVFVNHGLPG